MNYFIDECGHSGDLARNNASPDFGDQPVFTLAAIGVTDEVALQNEIEGLKAKHNVRLVELKSSKLVDRPAFTLDVVRLVCTGNIPWFIEVMDKKFTIATYILSFQLLPPIRGFIEDQRSHFVKNVLADYIFDRAPDRVFTAFVDACSSPSDASLRRQLDALIEFLESAPAEEIQSVALLELVKDAFNDYRIAVEEGEKNAYKRYFPPPDKNKHNKPVWMLPNQTAFTNIYARINLYERGHLSNVRLVHDEQHQFDKILELSKATVESLQDEAAEVFTPHSDFRFRESASLEFSRSSVSLGLQVADVLAGFCMRYAKDFFEDRNHLSSTAHATYDHLRRHTNPMNGTGINLVMSTEQHRELSLFAG
jgi:hypothetical protein